MTGTFNGVVEYSCLGDWFIGKNHYFAVANTKESRKDEKYRCFLKNRDDDLYIGVSITAEWWVKINCLKFISRKTCQTWRIYICDIFEVLCQD